jgi:hypothetical protein
MFGTSATHNVQISFLVTGDRGRLTLFIPPTHAKVGHRPPICHPDRSAAEWRDLRFTLMEKLSPEAIHHRALPVPENATADPSTPLRFGRDDKLEGGGPLWHEWRGMDRSGGSD